MVAKSLKKPRRRTPTPSPADQPLVRVLIAEATRRGDTLTKMAAELGVSYQHVTHWRRNEYDIAKANRPILEAAGRYLKVPTVTVLCLAGVITLEDFSEPGKSSLLARLRLDLDRMRQDPFFAGFRTPWNRPTPPFNGLWRSSTASYVAAIVRAGSSSNGFERWN